MTCKRLCAAMLFFMCFAAGADDLGRLFFTPQERENLDRQRRGEKTVSNSTAPALNGFIKRSDGRNTIWVDGTPMRATEKQVDQSAVDNRTGGAESIQIRPSAEQAPGSKSSAQEPSRKPQPSRKTP